jgi:hypothetical protein
MSSPKFMDSAHEVSNGKFMRHPPAPLHRRGVGMVFSDVNNGENMKRGREIKEKGERKRKKEEVQSA